MKRSQRQLARVRQQQAPALTPMSMSPTTPAPTPTAQPALTAAELAAQREERIETAIRRDAVVFGLKMQLQWEESDHKKERKEVQEQYARLLSRIERLEQDALNAYTRLREMFVKMADEHKAELYAAVKDGKFCGHAAVAREDLVKEIDSKELKCQQNQK
jgi:hypothetical protein